MSEIDWLGTPLWGFWSRHEIHEDGTYTSHPYPLGKGEAQSLMTSFLDDIERAYVNILDEESMSRWETTGEMPIIRDGQTTYLYHRDLTLKDLPAVLDTLVVLDKEAELEGIAYAERKAAERTERKRILAKERRKLNKLGEW